MNTSRSGKALILNALHYFWVLEGPASSVWRVSTLSFNIVLLLENIQNSLLKFLFFKNKLHMEKIHLENSLHV